MNGSGEPGSFCGKVYHVFLERVRRRCCVAPAKHCSASRPNTPTRHIGKSGREAAFAVLAGLLATLGVTVSSARAQDALGFDPYVTFAGNVDMGYHKTQFFEANHNVTVGQWDSRTEVWLPPFRSRFSWGPYLRVAGIVASRAEPWENAWLAGPGVGFQIFPCSLAACRKNGSALGRIFGPLRLFAEYNRTDYWGKTNEWRPNKQKRIGIDYWRSLHVNDGRYAWWAETWNGLWWQSANEFDAHYNAWILGNALRSGVRVPRSHNVLSAFTPYVALESSLTDQRTYYWENRLLAGGGLRFAPPLNRLPRSYGWFNRLAVYAEYLHAAAYYRLPAPPSIPKYDVRIGITASVGQWYR